jgi:O-antigen ligase
MKERNYTILIVLVYLWVLVANPQARFDFIGAIRLEKILVILAWLTLFLSGKMQVKFDTISGLVVLFFFWLMLSFLLSPYGDYYLARYWVGNYWKLLVVYFLLFFAIKDEKDIKLLITGYLIVIALYQMHSWMDFLRGGSYVYQQGIKRMVGIWTGGIGAANYYGMISMLSLPFAYFVFNTSESKHVKRLLIIYAGMTFASVFFSGTRGALLGVLVFVFLSMKSFKQVFKSLLLLLTLVSVAYFALPDYLQYRYFGMIVEKKYDFEIDERADEISKTSAEDRMMGLYDGWDLALLRPILGYGPGTSPEARKEVNDELKFDRELNLQMHNLYGQILAESGFVGFFIFMITIMVYLLRLRRLDIPQADNVSMQIRTFLQTVILLYLYYGMISHTLYKYYWFLMFAIHGGFMHMYYVKYKKKKENNQR